MGDHKAFFYGTLMAPEVLYRVCYGTTKPSDFHKSLLTVRPAILHDFERHRVKQCDYPAIIPTAAVDDEASTSDQAKANRPSVRGTYVTGLTDGDVWRIDIFEGPEYKRINVKVHPLSSVGDSEGRGNVESTEPVEVKTYVWIADRNNLDDAEWDFADFVRTKMARWTGGWEEYEGKWTYREVRASIQEVDEAVKALGERDPTNGRGKGGAITEKLREEGASEDTLRGAA